MVILLIVFLVILYAERIISAGDFGRGVLWTYPWGRFFPRLISIIVDVETTIWSHKDTWCGKERRILIGPW